MGPVRPHPCAPRPTTRIVTVGPAALTSQADSRPPAATFGPGTGNSTSRVGPSRAARENRGKHVLDYVIKGGTVVDGTGAPGRAGRRRGARRAHRGRGPVVDEPATTDARRRRPGRHARASSTPTPTTTPSSSGTATPRPRPTHGVTTVIGGNCGFTLAPLRPRTRDYTRRMMAQVEGMPLAALENGVDWNWETFAEYLDRPRRPDRRQRRLPGRPLRAPALRDGRRRRRERGLPRAARCHGPASLAPVPRGRWPRASRPRCRSPTPTVTGARSPSRLAVRGRAARPVRRGRPARRHDPRGHRRRLPRHGFGDEEIELIAADERRTPTGRSTGTCSRSTASEHRPHRRTSCGPSTPSPASSAGGSWPSPCRSSCQRT